MPTNLPDLGFGLEASWEPDLWGRLGHLQGAARARYLATIEGSHLVIANLVADVAAAYFELIALDRVQQIVTTTIARQSEQLELMRVEKQAGRTNELAVEQFAAQLASTRALGATTLQQAREVEHRIDLLLGRLPRPIARSQDALERDVPPGFAAGIPSALLRNRPDLRAAELEVQAAHLDVSAARAAFYPRLDISASLGYDAFDPRFLLTTPESLVYGLAAGLVAPLVNRRGIEAAFATARAAQIEAMYRYQGTVLKAFLEVATGLSAIEQAGAVVAQQRAKLAALADAVDAASALFHAGKATYLEVLVAQQNSLDAELELTAALRDQHLATVGLYKALGGGWQGTVVPRAPPGGRPRPGR